MKKIGTKNIGIEGFKSIRQYVFTQFVIGKSAQEVIKDLETNASFEHLRAERTVFEYRRQYFKKLKRD